MCINILSVSLQRPWTATQTNFFLLCTHGKLISFTNLFYNLSIFGFRLEPYVMDSSIFSLKVLAQDTRVWLGRRAVRFLDLYVLSWFRRSFLKLYVKIKSNYTRLDLWIWAIMISITAHKGGCGQDSAHACHYGKLPHINSENMHKLVFSSTQWRETVFYFFLFWKLMDKNFAEVYLIK